MTNVKEIDVIDGLGLLPDGEYEVAKRFIELWPANGEMPVSMSLLLVRNAVRLGEGPIDFAFYVRTEKEIGDAFKVENGKTTPPVKNAS